MSWTTYLSRTTFLRTTHSRKDSFVRRKRPYMQIYLQISASYRLPTMTALCRIAVLTESSHIELWHTWMSHVTMHHGTHEWVMSHRVMAHMNESCHNASWHTWMGHVTMNYGTHEWVMSQCIMAHMNESCHNELWHTWMSHVTMNHGTHEWVMSQWVMAHMNESCHNASWHTWMGHVTMSYGTNEWVMSQWVMAHMNGSCHNESWHKWMSHITMSHGTHEWVMLHMCVTIIVRPSADFWKMSAFPGFCGVLCGVVTTRQTTKISGVSNPEARKQTKCGVRGGDLGPTDLRMELRVARGGPGAKAPPLATRPLVSFQRNVAKET